MARKTKTETNEDTAPTTLAPEDGAQPAPEAATRAPRPGSKLAQVVALLEAPGGATIAEIMAATSWQQHTVRGALAGSITKKFGRTVTSAKVEDRGRVYRVEPPTP